MSRARHANRGRTTPRARPCRIEDDTYGVLIVAATEADLPEARQRTHDALIGLMGDGRTGPIEWRQAKGAAATAILDIAARDPVTPELADYYRRVRAMVRENGGWLVMALAPGNMAAGSTGSVVPRASATDARIPPESMP